MGQYMGLGGIEEAGWRKGPWTGEEDRLLVAHVNAHGEGRWNNVARRAGLRRNGKSCRFRWMNYLRPDLKRGRITPHEESVILQLHAVWGNRWSVIARSLPGRTDNEIKNYWRTHFKKRVKSYSQNPEKMRARLLRRQQFFRQQQQLQQRRQDQLDMQMVTQQLFDNECMPNFTEGVTDAHDEQGFFYSIRNTAGVLNQDSNENMIIWDGIWNLDEL